MQRVMVGFTINGAALAGDINRNLTLFQSLSVAYETGMYKAAMQAVYLTTNRIVRFGVSSDGEQLYSKSKNSVGAYGQQHGKARRERGLQTARVDLTFTGAMMANFNMLTLQPLRVTLGFSKPTQAAKMAELEAYYGADIISPSEEEEEEAISKLENEIVGLLDKLFA